jgi:hypothetical protein
MASSGYTTLQLYHSETPGVQPSAGDLIAGELAINTADGKLFYKNTSGTVSSITGGGGSGGSGYSGYSGYSGLGLSGYSGYSGQNGAAAASGYSGYSGQTGASGISGYSGSGISGFSGYSGAGGGGSVTSVNAFGGITGLSFTGGPITTSGTLTLGGTLGISGGGTNTQTAPTAGGVAFGTGTAYAFTSVGTTGQFLKSNGASNPTFGSLTSTDVTNALGYIPPTATGFGATGSWPININGTAASATTATTATSATTATTATTAAGLTGNPNISVSGIISSGGFNFNSNTSWAYNSGTSTAQLAIGGSNAGTFTTSAATFPGTVGTSSGGGTTQLNVSNSTTGSLQLASNGVGVARFGGVIAILLGTGIPSSNWNEATGDYTAGANAYKPGGGVWGASSDARLKSNAIPLTGALNKITALNPVTYSWKYTTTEPTVGFIAQEVQSVLPSAVSETTPTNAQKPFITNNKVLAVGWQNDMIAYLVGAIKELKTEIDALKAAK